MIRRRHAVLLAACSIVGLQPPAAGQEVTGEQVARAIRRGVAYLKSRQQSDGEWPKLGLDGGTTALSVVAMLSAGVSADDPAVRRALDAVARRQDRYTYVVALKIMALAMADPQRHARRIQQAADFLIDTQLKNGDWSYPRGPYARGDHSNTQFALLGLHEAAQAGARVPNRVWQSAQKQWVDTQLSDGGWGYGAIRSGRPTGSMTAAGVASLYIVGNCLETGREKGFTNQGRAPHCGSYSRNVNVADGLNWLTKNFSVTENPGSRTWHLYYLYGLERVGMLTGFSRLGEHDWYREGAAHLVEIQQADGSWHNAVHETAFALLFLGKGHRSILMNKLRWSRGNEWREDRNDAAHLTAWLGTKLGQPVTWQVVDLADPMTRWLEAPILYFNGHRFPRFTQEQAKKLRKFVELGGTILAEACCGADAFREGMQTFAAQNFGEWPMQKLAADHPAYHAMFELKADDFELEGIDLGCRTSVIFSPRDFSCLWEQGNIPVLSERAFRMGANIAAYVTGKEPLPDRLSVVEVPPERRDRVPTIRGGLQFGQVVHSGGWRAAPHALPNLARHLNERANVDVVTKTVPIHLAEENVFEYPVIYLGGHFEFTLTPPERETLKRYLNRGGFLFADACAGRTAFDKAFRQLMADMFGQDALKPLPPTHPILTGQVGYDISRVTYQPALQREQPDLTTPVLEGVELHGRSAVVYSRYDIACALEGYKCPYCRGYIKRDAERVAINIVLYALSY